MLNDKNNKKYKDEIDWNGLSRNTNIPYHFFLPIGREDREKHISSCEQLGIPDKVNWYWLSENTNIPVEFFETYISSCKQKGVSDKINWIDYQEIQIYLLNFSKTILIHVNKKELKII